MLLKPDLLTYGIIKAPGVFRSLVFFIIQATDFIGVKINKREVINNGKSYCNNHNEGLRRHQD